VPQLHSGAIFSACLIIARMPFAGVQGVFRSEDAVLDGSRFQQLDELLSKTDLYTKFLRWGPSMCCAARRACHHLASPAPGPMRHTCALPALLQTCSALIAPLFCLDCHSPWTLSSRSLIC